MLGRYLFEEYLQKFRELLKIGLLIGDIRFYDDELIKRLRGLYYKGIPASVILLSKNKSAGLCSVISLLMAKALIDENPNDEIKVFCVTIDALRLNPEYIELGIPDYAKHYVVQRTTKDGILIYDTSFGYIFPKDLYYRMQNPMVEGVIDKDSIVYLFNADEEFQYELDEKYLDSFIPYIQEVEQTYYMPDEKYSFLGLLQREVNHFKMQVEAVINEKGLPF